MFIYSWMEEPGGLQSMGLQRVGHDWTMSLSLWKWFCRWGNLASSLTLVSLFSCQREALGCRGCQSLHFGLRSGEEPRRGSMPSRPPWEVLLAQLCLTLWDHVDYSSPGFSCLWGSPGKNTEVSNHSLLQEIFWTQGLNPGLLHYRKILYRLSYQGSLYGKYAVFIFSFKKWGTLYWSASD